MSRLRLTKFLGLIAAAASIALLGMPAAAQAAPTATPSAETCGITGLGDPNTCGEAVTWAKNHITTAYHSDYDGRCDHVMALAYGFSSSASTTAHAHWLAIPAQYKFAGDNIVPAGGLAFFSGGSSGYGHVMISIGGGDFISTDIHGSGTFTKTTIAEIKNTWGETYVGWAKPWFQVNH